MSVLNLKLSPLSVFKPEAELHFLARELCSIYTELMVPNFNAAKVQYFLHIV